MSPKDKTTPGSKKGHYDSFGMDASCGPSCVQVKGQFAETSSRTGENAWNQGDEPPSPLGTSNTSSIYNSRYSLAVLR